MANRNWSNPIFWGLAVTVFVLSIALAEHLGRPELAQPSGFAALAMLIAVKACWDLHDRLWFWTAIVAIAALHAPLIMLVRWPKGWTPGVVTVPIGILDVIVYIVAIDFLEKVFGGSNVT